MIEFTLYGKPVAKGRPRTSHKDGFFRIHTDKKTKNYETFVAQIASTKMVGKKPIEGAVLISFTAYMPMPASQTKKWKAAALRHDIYPIVKPDLDNLVKAVLDAINGIVIKDDKQIVDLILQKRYSDKPRIKVVVRELLGESLEKKEVIA